jgi:hypothetical protein
MSRMGCRGLETTTRLQRDSYVTCRQGNSCDSPLSVASIAARAVASEPAFLPEYRRSGIFGRDSAAHTVASEFGSPPPAVSILNSAFCICHSALSSVVRCSIFHFAFRIADFSLWFLRALRVSAMNPPLNLRRISNENRKSVARRRVLSQPSRARPCHTKMSNIPDPDSSQRISRMYFAGQSL